jgi:hypothetical protein
MNPLKRYIELTQEFEIELDRGLTDKEEDFIKWIVEQEIDKERQMFKKALSHC